MMNRRSFLAAFGSVALVRHAHAAAVPVTLAISSNSLAYGGLRIAQAAGLFETSGIVPTITVMDSGNAAMTAVLSRSVEFCSASLGEVLAARVRGQKIVVLANIYRGLSGSLVLAKAVADKLNVDVSAPIQAKLRAIGGLAVATPSATSSYTYPFKIAAQALGVQPHFVYMAQPAMLAALKAGAVQAIIAGAPFSTAAVASNAGVMWINGPKGELPADAEPTSSACIETSEAYAAAHPDVVERLRASFTALGTFMTGHPDEAQQLLARAYPQLDANTIAAVFRDDGPNWTRPVMNVEDVRHEITIQESIGALPGVANIDPASVLLP